LKVKLDALEIVGGGTRMPILQKIIQEVFGQEPLKTLNATECIARGASVRVIFKSLN
jgi:molecular chaperone DnaK (HSP70)